ncbi:hypothetical protein ABTX82_10875 [Streptomyces lavendulae]|uniref:hypothetical protein n=1 Tax=Streptomyces lavendulae TaxID=1914 RepID=UPI00332C9B72
MSALTPPLGRPLLDPADHFPDLAVLRSAVQLRDVDAVVAAFDSLPDEDDRALACRVAGEQRGCDPFAREAAAARPEDALFPCLAAESLILRGWEIRSNLGAEHVTQHQFDSFHSHLRKAEILLIDVCAEHPDSALAWYLRLITARGLELGQSEARRRYERLAEHHPHHYSGQTQLLQQLCPKWGGTWEEAEGFALTCAGAAPEGNPNGALVATFQMERYLETAEKQGKRAAAAYLSEPAQHTALREAASRSVLHAAARPGAYQSVAAHNAFAAAHSAAGRPEEAAPHFRALGDRANRHPWGYLNRDQAAEFARHRKTALAKG